MAAAFLALLLVGGCATYWPNSGPSTDLIERTAREPEAAAIQIVEVDNAIARTLAAGRSQRLFSETLGNRSADLRSIGVGDVLEVSIWEATPATLFGSSSLDSRGLPGTSRALTLPEQIVGSEGTIGVPFAGRIRATGQTLEAIEAEIVRRLTGKANQPEVLVRRTKNLSATATVVGDVTNSTRVPLLAGSDRLLDAIAAAAGVKHPVSKVTIQLTRESSTYAMPLESIIADPKQNVPLRPGDVVTAHFQPLSFTALGATGKNEEVAFESTGITLAQALARVGGLIDTRSHSQGVFVFRFEPQNALAWPRQPVMATPDGRVPVVYRIDLSKPESFFAIQGFPMQHKDLLFVSNAPGAELQKFLNVIISVTYPILTTVQVVK